LIDLLLDVVREEARTVTVSKGFHVSQLFLGGCSYPGFVYYQAQVYSRLALSTPSLLCHEAEIQMRSHINPEKICRQQTSLDNFSVQLIRFINIYQEITSFHSTRRKHLPAKATIVNLKQNKWKE
jgi:hypothetical protein